MTSTELGIVTGFIGSALPEALKLLQGTLDKTHEIALLKLQMRWERQAHRERLDEIQTIGQVPELIIPSESFGKAASLIRPVLTLAFFILFALVRIKHGFQWTDDDAGLFATIITFWFGGRGFARVAGRVK